MFTLNILIIIITLVVFNLMIKKKFSITQSSKLVRTILGETHEYIWKIIKLIVLLKLSR